jgi:hypothetical protein
LQLSCTLPRNGAGLASQFVNAARGIVWRGRDSLGLILGFGHVDLHGCGEALASNDGYARPKSESTASTTTTKPTT